MEENKNEPEGRSMKGGCRLGEKPCLPKKGGKPGRQRGGGGVGAAVTCQEESWERGRRMGGRGQKG